MTTAAATSGGSLRAGATLRRGGICPRHWIYAVLLTIGWHGVWWAWLQSRPPAPRSPLGAVPQVAYLPAHESRTANAVADVRDLWSPAVFSLPAPAGFSGAALTNGIGARSPVRLTYDPPPLLDRTSVPDTGAVVASGAALASLAGAALTNLGWPGEREPVFGPAAAAREKLGIEILGGLRGYELERSDVPDEPRVFGATAWDAMAVIEVNSKGRVLHVFLEDSPGMPAVNGWIVRTLMGWRFEVTGDTVRGRVRLTWPGRAAAAGDRS